MSDNTPNLRLTPFLQESSKMPPLSVKESSAPSNVDRAAEIFSKYGDFILAVIRYQAGNDVQADDLYQDFFLSLVSNPIPAHIQNIKGYLYRTITNDIVDAARRVEKYHTRMHKYAERLAYSINKNTPENALIEEERLDKMFALIEGRLPRSEAQAITSRFRDNFGIKEVAKQMHVNNRTVSRYISAGLSKVRQFLSVKKGN